MIITPITKVILLAVFGTGLGFIGLSLYISFPSIFKFLIEKNLVIDIRSQGYEYWINIPVPIYLEIYLFNVTNTMDIYQLRSKPRVQEVGPFTFLERRQKVDIEWHENGTISYRQIKQFYYLPDRSNGSLDDEITQLNALMMIAAAKAKQMNSFLAYLPVSELFDISGSTWFVTKTARQWLFDGYTDRLFNISSYFADMPVKKFSWFHHLNGTDDGHFTVFTGTSDIRELNNIDRVNGLPYSTGFDSPCNGIHASTGDMFPPFQKEDDGLTVYASDICRNMHFTFSHKSKYHDLESFMYFIDKNELDNGQVNPAKKCFCVNNDCLPFGALDISRCQHGVPFIVSYPHYMFGDRSYTNGVLGLQQPDLKKHQSFMELEPNLGIVLSASAKLQMNILFEGNENIPQFQNLTGKTYVPAFWASKTAALDEDMTSKIKFVLKTVPVIVEVMFYFVFFFSILFIIIAYICYVLHKASKNFPISKKNLEVLEVSVPLKKSSLKIKAEFILNRESVL